MWRDAIGSKRTTHDRPRPRTEGNCWRTATGFGASATRRAKAFPTCIPAIHRCVLAIGTSARAVPDDLQWLDSATLELLEDFLTQADVQHLLIIGAYRDNEVDISHPLARKIAGIRKAGASTSEIKLAALSQEEVAQLIAERPSMRGGSCLPARTSGLRQDCGHQLCTLT